MKLRAQYESGRCIRVLGLLCCLYAQGAFAQYPPLSVQISPGRPLFIFEDSGPRETTPEAYAQHVLASWESLAEAPEVTNPLRSYSLLAVNAKRPDPHRYYQAFLPPLQDAGVPLLVRIADDDPRVLYPLDELEELLRTFTTVKGIEVAGLAFNEYPPLHSGAPLTPPAVQWLMEVIDIAARYGRFVYIPLADLDWPRMMSNTDCQALYEKIRAFRDYVIPANLHRGDHHIPRHSALLGLWLEEAVTHWGIAADGRWYTDANFISPGRFGVPGGAEHIPSSIYRAMILNGAMTGATVYAFGPSQHLWFGEESRHWDEAILPTLRELIELSLIARKDFVQRKAPVAYQLAPARTPQEFHLNLRDIDPVYNRGLLVHGAYGVERAGQIPELVLNRGDFYWVPLISAHAPEQALAPFAEIVSPGRVATAEQWATLLARHHARDGEGDAFISEVMHGIFVMNTHENTRVLQRYFLPEVPAPVRALTVTREDGAIKLSWPLRENDVSWDVYRRILPEERFTRIASSLYHPSFTDEEPGVDQPIAYAVTALTKEKEPLEGTVGYGEYLTFSTIYSRIAEEAVLSPVLTRAESEPIAERLRVPRPAGGAGTDQLEPIGGTLEVLEALDRDADEPWWPSFQGVSSTHLPVAQEIVGRIEAWEAAFSEKDLQGILGIYAEGYEDPQGWQRQYVQRAYQWFFERYDALRMDRQIRRWDFSNYESGGIVNVLLYCRLAGVAFTDSTGRIADVPVSIPRTESSESWITWTREAGAWRIQQTNPALPNFSDLLSYSAGPHDYFPAGPDIYQGE